MHWELEDQEYRDRQTFKRLVQRHRSHNRAGGNVCGEDTNGGKEVARNRPAS
jgi:hypothetical protein